MTLLIRLLSVLVISASLFVAGCSSGGSSAGFDKEDTDGDGIADIYDPDIDGDGIPNGQDPDIDGDGIPNDQDPDMDGDGKPNGKDPDPDGDGKPNDKDPDPENNDPNYCDRIQVFGLNDGQTTGSVISISWQLQSSKTGDENCVLKDGVTPNLVAVNASAAGAKRTTSERTNPVINTRTTIRIPAACTGETVEVTYDFTEIATLIKADPNAPGWTVKQRHMGDAARCDTDGDGFPDFGPEQCPDGATGTYPNCSCPATEYDGETNSCKAACTKVYLILTDNQLDWSQSPKGCALSTEQSDLELGVEWFMKVRWNPGSQYDITWIKDQVGPKPGVYDLKGKLSNFPLSYDPCVALDPSKFAQESGTVNTVEVEYITIPELGDAAEEAGLTISPAVWPVDKATRGISTCALKPGDPLPPGSTASASDSDNDGIPNDSDPAPPIPQITISTETGSGTKMIPISMETAKPTVLIRMPMVTAPPMLKMTRRVALSNYP